MDIVKRNFFKLLRSGALNEFDTLEPMSPYKWRRLMGIAQAQRVGDIALRGLRNHQYDKGIELPRDVLNLQIDTPAVAAAADTTLSNKMLNRRLDRIRKGEPHVIDASMDTLYLLNLLVDGTVGILTRGISIGHAISLGRYLRTKGDKVDFVKLERWLHTLHLQRMAQLQGSVLISVLDFEQDEVPFVQQVEPQAFSLTMRSLDHAPSETDGEMHFWQAENGMVHNNSTALRQKSGVVTSMPTLAVTFSMVSQPKRESRSQ